MNNEQRRRLEMLLNMDYAKFSQLMEVANLPEEDFKLLVSLPRKSAFGLGFAAALGTLGGALWALIQLFPEKMAHILGAASEAHP